VQHCVLPPRSSVIERNILKHSWRKCLPKLKINHYIVPFGRKDESVKQRHHPDCAGNCFAYDNDKTRPAVHKEKLGHALSLNMMRCEMIHDGEIFPNHWSWSCWPVRLGLRMGLAFLPVRFFWHTYEPKMCDYLIYLLMNYREYQIHSLQKFSSNQSVFANFQVQWLFCERIERALQI
jgi:hypothetical protein